MNQEQIHDALNLLDDDMIETVDELRAHRKKKKTPWMHWMAVAACLCVMIGGIYGAGRLGLFSSFGDKKADGATCEESSRGEQDDQESAVINPNESEETVLTAEIPSVQIKIISVQEDGFTGIVSEIIDTEIYKVGTEVTVKYENMADITVGSSVKVRFAGEKTEEMDGDIILYAEEVEVDSD